MKSITREVTMYSYTFANIDISNGTTSNMETLTFVEPLTQKEVSAICKQRNNALCIAKSETKEKYSMPLSEFVTACRNYAQTVGIAQNENDEDA